MTPPPLPNTPIARTQFTAVASSPAATLIGTAPAEARTMLRVRGFSSWYGSFQALKSLDLEIPAQHVTAFIGPSGCGKTAFPARALKGRWS